MGVTIRRKFAENIRNKEFKNRKSTLCSTPHGQSISLKNLLLFNVLASQYTIYKIDNYKKIGHFIEKSFLTLSNIDLDDMLCDM